MKRIYRRHSVRFGFPLGMPAFRPYRNLLVLSLTILASCQPAKNDALEEARGNRDMLIGTGWVLESYGPANGAINALDNTAVTIRFENNTLQGTAGCNGYSATYEVNGRSLTPGPIAVAEMACPEPDVMAQEVTFLAALSTATTYELADETLTIVYDGGSLRFVPETQTSAALETTIWQLETLEQQEGQTVIGMAVPEGMLVTLTFEAGQLGGSSGCNNFGAPYQVNGSQLTIDTLNKTEALCPNETQISAEGQLFKGLATAESFKITADQLTIRHPGGSLIFRAQAETSAVPSTPPAQMVMPPAAMISVGSGVQFAGSGTYGWRGPSQGDETIHLCADMVGIPTPPEPLILSVSPVSAQLTPPLPQALSHLYSITFPVAPTDEQASEAGGYRWWNFPEGIEASMLPLEVEQELDFDWPACLYLVQVFAWWDG